MPEAQCHLYDITHPEPSALTTEIWSQVRTEMERTGWIGEPGSRIGFVSTIEYRGLIAGYFANEGRKRGFQYDENKQPIETPQYSFEHLFFAIFSDTSQILLQSRNIYGYEKSGDQKLGMTEMRQNFLHLLTVFLRAVGVGIGSTNIQISSAAMSYTSEELFTFFIQNPTLRIDIKNMDPSRIPGEASPLYRLYNPRDEWNDITWGAVAETLRVGTRNIALEADREDPDAQLNKGPLPKAFAITGEIEELTTRNEDGFVTVRKKTADEEIRIDLPARPEILTTSLDLILERFDSNSRESTWKERLIKRQSTEILGPLFTSDYPSTLDE